MSRLVRRVPLRAIVVSEDAVEVMPPPPEKKREIVLGLPASNAVPPSRGRSRAGAAGSAKRKRCTRSEEGEVSARLSQHRSKFVSLIDGMLGDCGLETSTLEARISDLERDLGKTVSSLLKAKEEKKSKSSEVRRLKRRIQRFEEMGTCTAAELAGPSSSGTLVPSSEIPEVQDAGIVADKGGEEVGEGDGEAVPALGESEDEGGVPEDA
ncbi:Uncharacterized protein Rs2_41431 [Raphanus sativus]|nr:Uncharacterized protein Rs2_41431 [Raphanus sativus]